MIKVTVKDGSAEALKAFQALVKKIPREMKRIADIGAAAERSEHAYQNRTGRLERSTKAVMVRYNRREALVTLEMGMEYASYVRARGLSTINSQSIAVRDEIDQRIQELARSALRR